MKCPNCKIEMDQGSLYNHGLAWGKKDFNNFSKVTAWLTKNTTLVIAYRCPNCKSIQLVTDK